jgi:hypothetical protein
MLPALVAAERHFLYKDKFYVNKKAAEQAALFVLYPLFMQLNSMGFNIQFWTAAI